MNLYILGIALLFGGYVTFIKGMGAIDNRVPQLAMIRLVSGFLSFLFLILGGFIFAWWAPIAGILLAIILWMIVNYIALTTEFTMIHALRSHIGIFLGAILCFLSFFN